MRRGDPFVVFEGVADERLSSLLGTAQLQRNRIFATFGYDGG